MLEKPVLLFVGVSRTNLLTRCRFMEVWVQDKSLIWMNKNSGLYISNVDFNQLYHDEVDVPIGVDNEDFVIVGIKNLINDTYNFLPDSILVGDQITFQNIEILRQDYKHLLTNNISHPTVCGGNKIKEDDNFNSLFSSDNNSSSSKNDRSNYSNLSLPKPIKKNNAIPSVMDPFNQNSNSSSNGRPNSPFGSMTA